VDFAKLNLHFYIRKSHTQYYMCTYTEQKKKNGVLKLMKDLKPHKATGPEKIPPRLLKELAVELAPVFTILFNASLKQGVVPSDWRSAHVAPIFKKGDPLVPSNYMPVLLTSIPCKLLEHIVHSNIINHLSEKKILCLIRCIFLYVAVIKRQDATVMQFMWECK